jgi:tRNA-2-methylthio-N6-dimethylallyladenosine synthase
MTAPRYHLTSYGCQMNKLDSELVESKLRQRGYLAAATEAEASVVLVNTCSVRQHAEDRVWSKLGRLRLRKRSEPGLVVGVLGCMAQEHKRYLLSRMPHVDLVVGPSAFGDIDATVELARERNNRIAAERQPARTRHEVAGAGVVQVDQGQSGDSIRRDVRVRPHRSQAFVSVMRGCNMPCTYCIVPTTRGDEVSRCTRSRRCGGSPSSPRIPTSSGPTWSPRWPSCRRWRATCIYRRSPAATRC